MGGKIKDTRKKINITFDIDTYEQIKNIADKTPGGSMAEVVRNYTMQGLNGTLTESNMEFIAPIIREQCRNIIKKESDRLAAMISKTCIMSGTSAYLNAEVIANLLPVEQQLALLEAWDKATVKAVQYSRNKVNPYDILEDE